MGRQSTRRTARRTEASASAEDKEPTKAASGGGEEEAKVTRARSARSSGKRKIEPGASEAVEKAAKTATKAGKAAGGKPNEKEEEREETVEEKEPSEKGNSEDQVEGDGGKSKSNAKHGSPAKPGKAMTKKAALELAKKAEAAAERSKEPWTVLVHRKVQEGWKAYDPATMRPKIDEEEEGGDEGKKRVWRLLSWNVNGLRALLRTEEEGGKGAGKKGKGSKGAQKKGEGEEGEAGVESEAAKEASVLEHLAERERADVICLQETKIQEKDVAEIQSALKPFFPWTYWTCSTAKLGYSGCAILSKVEPVSVKYGLGNSSNHNSEGRAITVEFPGFFLITAYVPNSGEGLVRLDYRTKEWDVEFAAHIKALEASKPVVVTGDLNCAHQEIDIFHPEGNLRSAGFTIEERESFEGNLLESVGLVDTFRRQHPNTVAYTYWAYRSFARKANRGWRLDYFLVSESISRNVLDSYTVPDVVGSDHCPLGIILKV